MAAKKKKNNTLNLVECADAMLTFLDRSVNEIVGKLPDDIEVEGTEEFEQELAEYLEMEEWNSEDVLRMSALFYALAVQQTYTDAFESEEQPEEDLQESFDE